ncbi:MAG: hypothetical protein H6682_10770 [Candidatus Eisenbacteria bacterium]|nr:hypothetical protein [Candidatus Eisenbacteria bacterium]
MKSLIRAGFALAATVAMVGTASAAIDWAGNVYPNHGASILPTGDQAVYAQVYKSGVTDPGGQGADLSAVLKYTSDTHGSFEIPMNYLGDVGNNDEYTANIPQMHILGSTYIDVNVVFTDASDGTEYSDTYDQNGNPPPQRYDVVDVLPNDVDVKFTMCMSGTETTGLPCVIGSAGEIGSWGTGVTMNQIDTELYEVTVTFLAGGNPSFEYKYKKDDCQTWEGTNNRAVTLPTDGTNLVELEADSWEFLPIGCGLGNVLDEDREVCFQLCLNGIDYTGTPCVIGSVAELGNWADGVPMVDLGNGLYEACIVFLAGSPYPINVEYKYKKDDCETWEGTANRAFTIDNSSPLSQTFENTWEDQELDCSPTPVIEKTWGSIKGIYR